MSLTRLLLACGIVGPVLFVGMDWMASFWLYPGYDITAQQVSELSAIGAPSRAFWMAMGFPHAALTLAFAYGVWRASAGRWSLMVTAALLALFALNSFLWGWVAPMHMRGVAFTATDTLHIGFTIVAVLLMVGFMTIGARPFGGRFRWFSGLTVAAMLICANGGFALSRYLPTAWPRPNPPSTPSLMARLISVPVSSAMPNLPGPRAASTSSDVPPESAISKS